MNHRQFIISIALVAFAALGPAQAQDWPARPVTIINPFAAGGSDFAARAIAKSLAEKFGQPFLVETRPGAGGALASITVAKAAPDGYTLLLTAIGPAVLNQLLFKSVPYDTEKDFTPVILVGEFPQVIVSNPKLGFKTLQDLVEYGRSNPGKLNIGHAGAGSMGHLTGALFLARTGIQGILVGYRGAAPVVLDVLGGVIQAGVPVYTPAAKSVTILAVTSAQRIPFLPDIPTAREGGVDLIASTWVAILAPAGLPQDIVVKLNTAINQFLASPEGIQQFTNAGIRPLGGTPEHLAQVIKQDRANWAPVIAKENISLEPN
jgi:tripartite-type tricarboxylate transporter receptor subunit TctC